MTSNSTRSMMLFLGIWFSCWLLIPNATIQAQLFKSWQRNSDSGESSSPRIFNLFGQQPQAIPAAYTKPPSLTTLIADLNAKAIRIKQLNTDVKIKVKKPAGIPKISGTLQVEFPNRMRLKAGVMGISGIDAGSNEQEFWIWSKVDLGQQEPAMFYSRHDEYQNSRFRAQIPLEPQWLIDGLGIIQLDPKQQHYGPFQDQPGYLRLVSPLPGTTSHRQLLINAKTGVVEQVAIYQQTQEANRPSELLAYSNALEFEFYEKYNIALPKRIELHIVRPEPQELTIELGKYQINSLFGDPNQMWAKPEAAGIPKYNLGRQ